MTYPFLAKNTLKDAYLHWLRFVENSRLIRVRFVVEHSLAEVASSPQTSIGFVS